MSGSQDMGLINKDYLKQLVLEVVREEVGEVQNYGKRQKPYTVKQFADLTPWSERTIRNKIEAGQIRTSPLGGQMLIPASEYIRLFE